MRGRFSGFRIINLIVGTAMIALGILTFSDPAVALSGLLAAYGIAAIAIGVIDVITYIRIERFTGFGPVISLIMGILGVMSGIMLFAYPNAGRTALLLLFPIWFIAHCISRLASLPVIRFRYGTGLYIFSLIVNAIGLVLGFLMLFQPSLSYLSISIVSGCYLIVLGTDSIISAICGRE